MSRPSNESSSSDLLRAEDLKGVDLWSLPSFDPERPEPEPEPALIEEIEEVPLEEVQPLTLEELESIRQEAYNEGFAVGEREGFHSTQLKVRQEAEIALAARMATLEELMSHLLAPIAEQDAQIEKSLVELVGHVTREVIQRELSMDSSFIETVLREALKLLPMGANNVRIFVNPQDFVQIKALRERHEETWRILEDPALLPGGCRVETEHSRIDASIETRITQALAQMFGQLHEQGMHPAEADVDIDLAAIEAGHLQAQERAAQARRSAPVEAPSPAPHEADEIDSLEDDLRSVGLDGLDVAGFGDDVAQEADEPDPAGIDPEGIAATALPPASADPDADARAAPDTPEQHTPEPRPRRKAKVTPDAP